MDFRRRWPMVVEYLRAMKELWTKREASFQGEFVNFIPVRCYPKPAQKPHPPVHICAGMGASRMRALKDTVALGDGWGPVAIPPPVTGGVGQLLAVTLVCVLCVCRKSPVYSSFQMTAM